MPESPIVRSYANTRVDGLACTMLKPAGVSRICIKDLLVTGLPTRFHSLPFALDCALDIARAGRSIDVEEFYPTRVRVSPDTGNVTCTFVVERTASATMTSFSTRVAGVLVQCEQETVVLDSRAPRGVASVSIEPTSSIVTQTSIPRSLVIKDKSVDNSYPNYVGISDALVNGLDVASLLLNTRTREASLPSRSSETSVVTRWPNWFYLDWDLICFESVGNLVNGEPSRRVASLAAKFGACESLFSRGSITERLPRLTYCYAELLGDTMIEVSPVATSVSLLILPRDFPVDEIVSIDRFIELPLPLTTSGSDTVLSLTFSYA